MQKTDSGGYRVVLQVSSFILYVKPLGNAITFRLDSLLFRHVLIVSSVIRHHLKKTFVK